MDIMERIGETLLILAALAIGLYLRQWAYSYSHSFNLWDCLQEIVERAKAKRQQRRYLHENSSNKSNGNNESNSSNSSNYKI